MEEQIETQQYNYKNLIKIILSIILAAVLAGGGIFYWQLQKLKSTNSTLQLKINSLERQLAQSITEQKKLSQQLSQPENILQTEENNKLFDSNEENEAILTNPKTFEKITDWYYKDKNFVYRKNDGMQPPGEYKPFSILTDSLDAFEIINDTYSKDDNNIFYSSIIIEDADIESFQIVDYPYSKDNNNVYIHSKLLEGADAQSFSIVKSGYFAKDKNFVYDMEGEIIEDADPATFVSPY